MKKQLFLLCMFAGLLLSGWNVMAQTVYVNTNLFPASEGWTTSTAVTATTSSSILCADGVTRSFYYNGLVSITPGTSIVINRTGSTAGRDVNNNLNYIEVTVPQLGTVTIKAAATGQANRDLTIWAKASGASTWTILDTCKINETTKTVSGLAYATPTTVRIANLGGTLTSSGSRTLTGIYIAGPVADMVPPVLAATNPLSPADGATGVSSSLANLSVVFNKNIATGTGDITISDGTTLQTVLLSTCSVSGDTLTIPVSGLLSTGKTYTVTIPAGAVTNATGTPTTAATVFSFTTAAALSSAKEIIGVNFGVRQVGAATIVSTDDTHGTVDVTVQYGTSLAYVAAPKVAQINVTSSSVSVSPFATLSAALPTDFSSPQTITVVAEDGTTKDWTITVHIAPLVATTIPEALIGTSTTSWTNIQTAGYASNILNQPSSSTTLAGTWFPAPLTQADQFLIANWTGTATMVSFKARYGNGTSNYTFTLQESATGADADWTTVTTFTQTIPSVIPLPYGNTTWGMRSYAVQASSRYLRWYYTVRNGTTFYLDDILIDNVPCESALTLLGQVNFSNSAGKITLTFNDNAKVSSFTPGITINGTEINENAIACNRSQQMFIASQVIPSATNTIYVPAGAIENLRDVCGNGSYQGYTISFVANATGEGVANFTITPDIVTQVTNPVSGSATIIKSQTFTIQGIEIPKATAKGVYIIKNTYGDGSVKVEKVIVK